MDNAPAAVDPQQAKAQILDYCRRKGALVAGIANIDTLQRIAPPGHRPRAGDVGPVLGEKACCFVVLKGVDAPTLPELRAYQTGRGISKVKLPERLEIIDAMPMTPTRKIIKARLRERLLGGASPSPAQREGDSR